MPATLEGVQCAQDERLHLAPREAGLGVSVYTLCLRRWRRREPCRVGVEFCAECLEKVLEKVLEEEHAATDH